MDTRTLRRDAQAAAIDRLAEAEGGARYKAQLAKVDDLAERLNDISERHEARVASISNVAESVHATALWQARLDELEAAFAAANDLGARLAAATANDPALELPPDTRPKPRPKAHLIRQVY
jgi:hypothetical protein